MTRPTLTVQLVMLDECFFVDLTYLDGAALLGNIPLNQHILFLIGHYLYTALNIINKQVNSRFL